VRTHARAFDICKMFIDRNHDLFNAAMARVCAGYGSHPDAGSAEAGLFFRAPSPGAQFEPVNTSRPCF